MKKLIVLALVAAFALASCDTLTSAVAGVVGGAVSGAVTGDVASGTSSAVTPMDFKAGELLCSTDSGSMIGAHFYLAKVLTPASAASKDQAEVLWLDGSKAWVNFVVESRKATKDDLAIGAAILYPAGWAGHESMDQDNYRKTGWYLGRVTDNSDLFKNMVEIDGDKYYVNVLRVPTSPVK